MAASSSSSSLKISSSSSSLAISSSSSSLAISSSSSSLKVSSSSSSSLEISSSSASYINVYHLDFYTAANDDHIRFYGDDGDFFYHRTNSRTTNMTINGNTIEWYNPVLDHTVILSSDNTTGSMSIIDEQCYIELLTFASPFTFVFNFQSKSCNYYPISDNLAEDLAEDLNKINEEPPPKLWQNYNTDYQNWIHFKILAAQGTICVSDIPDEPKIEEYALGELSSSSSSSLEISSSSSLKISSSSSSLKISSSSSSSSSSGIYLRDVAIDNVDDRLFVSKDKEVFSTQDPATLTYIRNLNCWAYGLDLTCISPWNSQSAHGARGGALISPRHIIFAAHYPIANGTTIRFITDDGTVVDRTTLELMLHPSYIGSPYYNYDTAISVLDSDVPGDISFAKILSSDYKDYLIPYTRTVSDYVPDLSADSNYKVNGIPLFKMDSEEKALVIDGLAAGLMIQSIPDVPQFRFQIPLDATRLLFYEASISGDSGNPTFMIINNEIVIASTSTWAGPGSGPSIADLKNDINAMMTVIDASQGILSGYQLTEIDLSSFKKIGL